MKYFFHVFVFLLLFMSFGSSLVVAQSTGPTSDNDFTRLTGGSDNTRTTGGSDSTDLTGGSADTLSLKNPIQAKSIGALFQAIIDIVLVFAIPVIVFFIILAGFRYVTARGNGHVIEEAHMALLYALIGGVLILGARVLIEVISGTVDAIKG